MSETEKFPLDFDSLKKGDVITADTITAYCGYKPDDTKFGFGALSLKSLIEKRLADRGYPVTTSMRGSDLHILHDSEALFYNINERDAGERKVVRSHRRMLSVDRSQLTDSERTICDRQIQIGGWKVSALVKVQKRIKSSGGYANSTPRGFFGEDKLNLPEAES
jgi:hypothetical protein